MRSPDGGGRAALRSSAVFWFTAAAAGQLLFAAYIIGLYWRAAFSGQAAAWNLIMANGHIPGDWAGNASVMAHVLLSAIITLGGLVQLVPQVRRHAPRFHRWNGRLYVTLAVVITLTGFYLTWGRPQTSGLANDLAISLNGALILIFAAFTVRNALARRFDRHQRWATRLFLAVSGVWFLRVMVMGWIGVNQGPRWLGSNLEGAAGAALSFAAALLPLAIYEVYWRIRERGAPASRMTMAAGLAALTLTMAGGIAMAAMFMWMPFMGPPS
jgi:hypothetical protein